MAGYKPVQTLRRSGGGKHFLTVVGAGAFSRYTKLKSTRPLLNCYVIFVNFWVAMALAYFSAKPWHLLFSQKRKLIKKKKQVLVISLGLIIGVSGVITKESNLPKNGFSVLIGISSNLSSVNVLLKKGFRISAFSSVVIASVPSVEVLYT